MTPRANPIGLASGVLVGCTAEVTIDAAARAGFDQVGLWVVPGEWSGARCAAVRRRVAESGLALIDVEVLRLVGGPLSDDARRMVEVAGEVGAPNLLVVGAEPDAAALSDAYAALCEMGAAAGVRLALEFMLFSTVATLAAARAIVAAAQSPAAALLVDPLHLDRSGGTPAEVAALPREWLPYAQFCDAPPAHIAVDDHTALLDEARDDRVMPGDGILPLAALLEALPPRTPLSIELRSRALRDRYPDPTQRAIAVHAAADRFLQLKVVTA